MPDLTTYIIIAPPILLALAFHEFAHGWVANRLGDPTAKQAGRLTMNPLSHLDLVGTIMLFVAHIGWAKPVPVNPYNLNNPRRDLIWVSLAGPAANIIMAAGFGLMIRLFGIELPRPLILVLVYGVIINISLAIFNMIPIPPLDGSRILGGLLPEEMEAQYRKLDRLGPMLVLVLVMGGYMLNIPILWWIIMPFLKFFSILFAGIDLSHL
ncbi:site-2 protease family protein [bacterium]|nr:site-2 protease family protein [bacterium]MBU1880460.1 site-2 protease family protein [bacterium]